MADDGTGGEHPPSRMELILMVALMMLCCPFFGFANTICIRLFLFLGLHSKNNRDDDSDFPFIFLIANYLSIVEIQVREREALQKDTKRKTNQVKIVARSS